MELLLSKGANINIRRFRDTSIMIAIKYNQLEVLELLLFKYRRLIKIANGDLPRHRYLFQIFKKDILLKASDEVFCLKTWKPLFFILSNSVESYDGLITAINRIAKYYKELQEYNLLNLELSICKLKNLKLRHTQDVKDNYFELIEEIILFIARCSNDIQDLNNLQNESLNQVILGINIITYKLDDIFKIKAELPKDILYIIYSHFKM